MRRAAIAAGGVLVTLDGDFSNILRWVVPRIAEIDATGKLITADEKRIRIRG